MKWKSSTPREYYSKYKKVEIKNSQGWFDVYQLYGDVFAICEPQHFQEVNAYLVIGDEKSLLLDTGMGICDIKKVAEELYTGEIIVVNSHFHFDHIGNNYKFEKVHIFEDSYAKAIAQTGLPKEGVGNQLDEDMFLFDYPKGFVPDKYVIPPYKVKVIEDGYVFDLGNRSLKVIHTPGHSNDSIMLFDNKYKILFTGDTFYLGALYIHFDCKEFGKSNIHDYYNSIKRISEMLPDAKYLYCSHNDFIVNPNKINELLEALHSIVDNKRLETKETHCGHTYLEDGEKMIEYVFDGFSIIIK